MATDGIVQYPVGAIKAHRFFGPAVKLLIDGLRFDNDRLDIVFPTENDLKVAVGKLVRVVMADRESALKFLLSVLDEFPKASNCPLVGCQLVGPHDHSTGGPVSSKQNIG
jgi:hypothetical protein